MTDPVDLAVDVLAVHRIVRLVQRDTITKPARESLVAAAYHAAGRSLPADFDDWTIDPRAPMLVDLLRCRWCLSVWVAAGVLVARRVAPRPWELVARGLALSSASTLIAAAET